LVPRAATDNASPPPLRSKPIAAVSADDVRRLYEAASEAQPALALAIYLAAATGLRRGELCALRWSDVEENGVLHVHAVAKHGLEGRRIEIRDMKTHQDRKVALDDTALAMLSAYRVGLVQAAANVDLALPFDGFILSLDPTGIEPMKPDSLGQAFRRVAHRLGVAVRFHDLRHFTATQLIGAGVDVRTVAARLAHLDPALTLRVHASFMEEQDRTAARIMGDVLGPGASYGPQVPAMAAKGSVGGRARRSSAGQRSRMPSC
jgi:integrase